MFDYDTLTPVERGALWDLSTYQTHWGYHFFRASRSAVKVPRAGYAAVGQALHNLHYRHGLIDYDRRGAKTWYRLLTNEELEVERLRAAHRAAERAARDELSALLGVEDYQTLNHTELLVRVKALHHGAS